MNGFEWSLVVGGGFIIALLMSGYLGVMNIPVSFVLYFIIIVSLLSTETLNYLLRINSSKLVATNFDTTTDGSYIPCGDYAVFTIGDIDYLFKIKSKQGAVVCPRDAINKLGKNVVLTINPKLVFKDELPPEVIRTLDQYGIEPPYYYGVVSERQELVEPKISRIQNELSEKNTLINMLREVSKGKIATVEELIEFVNRIKKQTEEKSWLQKIFGSPEEKEKKEE